MTGITITSNTTSFTGSTTSDVTIVHGVTVTASNMNVGAGNTIYDNGMLDLKVNDSLDQSPNGVILIGATGTLEIGSGFATPVYGQLAFGAAGGTIVLDSGVNTSVIDYVANIDIGDGIELKGVQAHTDTMVVNGTTTYVYLRSAGGALVDTIDMTNVNADVASFTLTTLAGNAGIMLEAACFTAGTELMTPNGPVAVESLRAGDLITTASGEPKPLRWLGRSTVSTRFADPQRVMPIRIKSGALAETLPVRDLLVSPDHAMFIGGILVQAAALVNGSSIVRETKMPESFVYYHVELASHELILAEGAATESFIDNTDRMNFDNWAEYQALANTAPIVEMSYPRVKASRQLPASVRAALAARIAASHMADLASAA